MLIKIKKIISFVLFVLYDYYEEKKYGKGHGYEQAIYVFLLAVFINLITVMTLFDLDKLIPIYSSDPRWLQYLKFAIIYVIPGYLFVIKIFKKSDIICLKYDEWIIRRGRAGFFVYFIFSFVLAMGIAVIKNG